MEVQRRLPSKQKDSVESEESLKTGLGRQDSGHHLPKVCVPAGRLSGHDGPIGGVALLAREGLARDYVSVESRVNLQWL